MAGDAPLRLFLAYRLPGDAVESLAAWAAQELHGRVVPPANLHVTLAFLGSRPAGDLPAVLGALDAAARDAAPPVLELRGWRETRGAGMLVFDDRTGHGAALAGRLAADLAELGLLRPERRRWLPHVTVLRYRERPGLRPRLPELAPVVPSDAAAFLSRLHPSRERYTPPEYVVLESFSLGG